MFCFCNKLEKIKSVLEMENKDFCLFYIHKLLLGGCHLQIYFVFLTDRPGSISQLIWQEGGRIWLLVRREDYIKGNINWTNPVSAQTEIRKYHNWCMSCWNMACKKLFKRLDYTWCRLWVLLYQSYLLLSNFVKQVLNPRLWSHWVHCKPSMSA